MAVANLLHDELLDRSSSMTPGKGEVVAGHQLATIRNNYILDRADHRYHCAWA